MTMQELQQQLGSWFGGGGNQQAGQFGGNVSPTGMTYPTAENTSMGWSPTSGASGSGIGFNMPTAGLALGGLQAIGGLLQSQKAFKLAKDQFKFTKDVTNTNLNNSIKSYNTSLEDRLNARGFVEGRDTGETAAEIERKRLTR